MDEIANARAALFATALRMHQIFVYLASRPPDELPMPVQLCLGAAMVSIARYCRVTNDIISNPTIEQPVLGRCIFY